MLTSALELAPGHKLLDLAPLAIEDCIEEKAAQSARIAIRVRSRVAWCNCCNFAMMLDCCLKRWICSLLDSARLTVDSVQALLVIVSGLAVDLG